MANISHLIKNWQDLAHKHADALAEYNKQVRSIDLYKPMPDHLQDSLLAIQHLDIDMQAAASMVKAALSGLLMFEEADKQQASNVAQAAVKNKIPLN